MIHRRCLDIKDCWRPDPNFKCQKYCQEREITPTPQLKHVHIGNNKLEVVRSLCYLGDVTSASCGCYNTSTSRIRSAWKKSHELIPIVCNKSFSLANRGHIYNSCVRFVLLYACETWPLNIEDLSRLSKVNSSMVRWICSGQKLDQYSMNVWREKLKLRSVQEHIKSCRLRWFGYLTRMIDER